MHFSELPYLDLIVFYDEMDKCLLQKKHQLVWIERENVGRLETKVLYLSHNPFLLFEKKMHILDRIQFFCCGTSLKDIFPGSFKKSSKWQSQQISFCSYGYVI